MEDKKKPPKNKRRHSKILKSNETVVAKPSNEQIKQIYMASKHLEWIPFAQSMSWDHQSTRKQYPVSEWITQKKEALAKEQAEQIAELIFDHRSRWHKNVLNTMRDYPDAADAVLGIIKYRQNELIDLINSDLAEKRQAQMQGRPANLKFSKIKTSELLALSAAVKVAVETKHKSLLINDWSVKIAEQFTDPKQFEVDDLKLKDTGWKLEVIGGENLTTKQMQEFIGKWYDKPNQIHQPEQLDPEKEEEE